MQVLTISDEVQGYLADVITKNPDLNARGWRFSQRGEAGNDGATFDEHRRAMLNPDFAEEVGTVMAWLQAHRLNSTVGSYELKHLVERWGASVGLSSYVTNGAAICAALLQGFAAVRRINSPNCNFSRSTK